MLEIMEELIPAYKEILVGRHAIALAGAHAKGKADSQSDLDLFIYTEDIASFEARRAAFERMVPDAEQLWISDDIVSYPWGGSIDFWYKGRKVETTLRRMDKLKEILNDCENGNIRIYPEAWTINGYYNYVYLSEIEFVKPIEDPHDILAGLKERYKEYPPALKKAILDHFWPRSRTWIDNFHYRSAIERMDIAYTSGIVNQTIQNATQVLFALNERYFYGDKKLESQLRSLAFCPRALYEEMEFLLTACREVEHLRRQRELLKQAMAEIEEKLRGCS